MNPTLKKRGRQRVCGDGVMPPAKKRVQSLIFNSSDEDNIRSLLPVANASKPRTSGALLNRVKVVKSGGKSRHRANVTPVKDVLHVGEIYDIIDIQTVDTCRGWRQVWSLRGVKDKTNKKVFSCADLDHFAVNVDSNLDQQDRCDMIKQIRVVHKEIRKPQGNEPSESDFNLLTK